MYDVIIIGSGPAGLTAAIYAIRASLKTLVIAGYKWGGQLMLTSKVENFPGFPDGIMGPDLMLKMRKQAENLGVEFVDKDAVEIDVSKKPFTVFTNKPAQTHDFLGLQTGPSRPLSLVPERDCGEDAKKSESSPVQAQQQNFSSQQIVSELNVINPALVDHANFDSSSDSLAKNSNDVKSGQRRSQVEDSQNLVISPQDGIYQTKSIIIATGADTKWMDVPGEKELIGRGVSSCAPCDAFFFKGKNVAVVGGGDSAMEEALVLAKVANSVTIIYRGDKFRASKVMQDRVFGEAKIKVVWNTVVTEVMGKEKVTGVKLRTSPPPTGGSSPARRGKEDWEMVIDGVFVAIGHRPNTMIFEGKIDLDEKGYVVRGCRVEGVGYRYKTMTNVDGVFVAGDVSDYKYMQGVTAAGFGCMAALDAQRWLEESRD